MAASKTKSSQAPASKKAKVSSTKRSGTSSQSKVCTPRTSKAQKTSQSSAAQPASGATTQAEGNPVSDEILYVVELEAEPEAVIVAKKEDSSSDSDSDDPPPVSPRARIRLNLVVHYKVPKTAKAGAGRPSAKSKPLDGIVELEEEDTFKTFSAKMVDSVDEIALEHKHKLGDVDYESLKLKMKVPKGEAIWKKPMSIGGKTAFKEFKTVIFKASDRFAECTIDLDGDQADSDSSEDDYSESASEMSDSEATTKKRKRSKGKGKAPESKKDEEKRLQDAKARSIKEINERWECDDDNCNPGGHCIVNSSGKHLQLTKAMKERWACSIHEAKFGSVKEPPSFLWDVPPKARGRNGPRPSFDHTPTRASTSGQAFAFILSSPVSAGGTNSGPRSQGPKAGPSSSFTFSKTLTDEFKYGPANVTVEGLGKRLNIHTDHVKRLQDARYVRMTQLARTYDKQFKIFLQTFKPSPPEFSDIEEMLETWSQMKPTDPLNAIKADIDVPPGPGYLSFGPSGGDAGLLDVVDTNPLNQLDFGTRSQHYRQYALTSTLEQGCPEYQEREDHGGELGSGATGPSRAGTSAVSEDSRDGYFSEEY
ncbi:hypothetical protein V8E36_007666 [Tilletia maclaganii]